MIRAFLAAIGVAAAALFVLLFVSVPGWSAGLHPRCNIDWPCATTSQPKLAGKKVSERNTLSAVPVLFDRNYSKTIPAREARRIARGQRLEQAMPFGSPIYPPETQRSFLQRGATILPHPPGCPRRAFCGCGAAVEVFGRPVRSLWLAANWLRYPRTSPAPGMVAARRGHVFVIKQVLGGGNVLAYDANSGGRRTRLHVRSLAGFVVVNPHG